MDLQKLVVTLHSLGIPKEQWGQWAIAHSIDRAASTISNLACADENGNPSAWDKFWVAIRASGEEIAAAISGATGPCTCENCVGKRN